MLDILVNTMVLNINIFCLYWQRKNKQIEELNIFLTLILNHNLPRTSRPKKLPWRTNRATSQARLPRAPSWHPPAPHRWWSPDCSHTSSHSTTNSNSNSRFQHSTHPHRHFWGRERSSGTRGSLPSPPGSPARTTARMRSWFVMRTRGKVRKKVVHWGSSSLVCLWSFIYLIFLINSLISYFFFYFLNMLKTGSIYSL